MKHYPPRSHGRPKKINYREMAKAVPMLFVGQHRHSPMPMPKQKKVDNSDSSRKKIVVLRAEGRL